MTENLYILEMIAPTDTLAHVDVYIQDGQTIDDGRGRRYPVCRRGVLGVLLTLAHPFTLMRLMGFASPHDRDAIAHVARRRGYTAQSETDYPALTVIP